jgi:hypothetical protein
MAVARDFGKKDLDRLPPQSLRQAVGLTSRVPSSGKKQRVRAKSLKHDGRRKSNPPQETSVLTLTNAGEVRPGFPYKPAIAARTLLMAAADTVKSFNHPVARELYDKILNTIEEFSKIEL